VTLPFAAERSLRYIFIFPVGLMGLWAALGLLFFPAMVARAIGWQTSPFQFEVGVANLGVGLAGLYAAFRSLKCGCGQFRGRELLDRGRIAHIRDIIAAGNFAPANTGPILLSDLLTPLVIFVLLWLARHDAASHR
jgi:hypothetical protein